MTSTAIEQFQQLVGSSPAIQAQLNAAPDNASFVRLAVQLGAANGYSFSEQEFRTAMAAMTAAPGGGELSDEQLESVAGGLLGDGCRQTVKPRSTYSYNCTDGSGPNCVDTP